MNADTRSTVAWHPEAGSENCLPIGTRLSDFEITGVLGEGGFGIVYVAYDRALQRTVAIKEYMPGVLAKRSSTGGVALRAERHRDTFTLGLKSFINEARLLAQFDHPALIKVYRFWEHNKTAYTAMKFYDGRTIKDIVTNSPELVDEAWCRKVLGQILQALDMLYTRKILHRDISPDNIIVQENGDAVLLDFGSARQIIGDMTRGLTVILKPGYAPVEQYAGDASLEQGPFTDLYALCAVMYFAITKTPPPASIGRMINDPIVALTKQAPAGYSEQLLAAIDKGLAVLAEDRPQTIDAFRKLLGSLPPEAASARAPFQERRAVPPARPAAPPPPAAPARAAEAPQPPARAVPPPLPAATPPQAPAHAAPGEAPAPERRRLLLGAAAAGVLAIGAMGLYALVGSPRPDTAVLAQPEAGATVAASPAGAPNTAKPAHASSDSLSATESFVSPVSVGSAASVAMTDAAIARMPATAVPSSPGAGMAPGAASAPEARDASAVASVGYKLRIHPWGTLFVDGVSAGVSPPLKQLALTPGKHEIRIVNPSFPAYVTTIEVEKNKPGTIAVDFAEQ